MSGELHRHHHERQKRRVPQLIGSYWVEILIALGLALSIFLLFEQMNIRGTLLGWAQAAIGDSNSALDRLSETFVRFRSRLGLSELIAIPMLIGICALIAWRVRWRLQRAAALTDIRCPKCGSSIHRVHRYFLDRMISLVVPVHRYHCSGRDCGWSGLRVSTSAHGGRSNPSSG